MFRHGERTPDPEQMQEFPKYEYINDTFSPYGRGQLTTVRSIYLLNFHELFYQYLLNSARKKHNVQFGRKIKKKICQKIV